MGELPQIFGPCTQNLLQSLLPKRNQYIAWRAWSASRRLQMIPEIVLGVYNRTIDVLTSSL